MSPKMRVQTQFHHAPGRGVAAERIHQIHQHVGSFTVVKVLVHFVPELCQLFGFHKLQLYAVPLFKQILSKVQYLDAVITVDNIEVAQFIYLILNNEKIRDVINTLTSKTVLILGRFALPERKAILDALRNKLREYDLLPIVFDFDRPIDKDFTETIKTLAGISYFVIADVTNPKSSPLELQATVPDYQIPFVPIIQEGEQPFSMMVDLKRNITGYCR